MENDGYQQRLNTQLASVDEDMFVIRMDADVSNAARFEIALLQGGKNDVTSYTYDVEKGEIVGFTQNKGEGCKLKQVSGSFDNDDMILSLEIYVDRSLAEAFFEDSKSISIRSYPEGGQSHGISLSAEGDVNIVNLHVASMSSIFEGK